MAHDQGKNGDRAPPRLLNGDRPPPCASVQELIQCVMECIDLLLQQEKRLEPAFATPARTQRHSRLP